MTHLGHAWSSVRGRVGSWATSATIWVISLCVCVCVCVCVCKKGSTVFMQCDLLHFVCDLVDVDTAVGGLLGVVTVSTLHGQQKIEYHLSYS